MENNYFDNGGQPIRADTSLSPVAGFVNAVNTWGRSSSDCSREGCMKPDPGFCTLQPSPNGLDAKRSVALDFQDVRVDAVRHVNRLQVLRHRKLMGLADVVRIGVVAPFAEPSQDLAVPIELEHHAFHAG